MTTLMSFFPGIFFFFFLLTALLMPCSSYANEKSAKINQLLMQYYNSGQLNGTVLVAEEGNIICKKAFGFAHAEWEIPNTIDSRYNLFSITKQFTALLILQLVERNKLKLDDTISKHLPYYRKDIGDKVTIHQLLTHSHGIPDIKYANLPLMIHSTVDQFLKDYVSGDPEFEPGTDFKYSALAGYTILGAIIQKVTGKSYEEILTERILKPLKMGNSGFIHYDKTILKMTTVYRESPAEKRLYFFSFPCNGASSIYSTVEDLYLWDQALMNHTLLSPQFTKMMFTPYVPEKNPNYAYGWYYIKYSFGFLERDVFAHSGGGCNIIGIVPEDNYLVIVLNNIQCPKLNEICFEILEILYGI